MVSTSLRVRAAGNGLLSALFLLAIYAFGSRAWHLIAGGERGLPALIWLLATLGAISLTLRYGRTAVQQAQALRKSSSVRSE
jgi:hypothetical protein